MTRRQLAGLLVIIVVGVAIGTAIRVVRDRAASAPISTASGPSESAAAQRTRGQLALTSMAGGDPDIWLVTPDGSGARNLTKNAWGAGGDGAEDEPDWSPDGDALVFTSDRPVKDVPDGAKRVFVIDAAGRNPRVLTSVAGSWSQPRWSSDGKQIALIGPAVRPAVLNQAIYIMSANGGVPSRLTSGPRDTGPISWDLNGRGIYFFRDGRRWWVDAITREVRPKDASGLLGPWSASSDGRWQAVVTRKDRNGRVCFSPGDCQWAGEIYTRGPGGGDGFRRLTHTREDESAPSWSEGGELVAFVRHVRSRLQVLAGSPANRCFRVVSPGNADAWAPDWSPGSPPPRARSCGNDPASRDT